MPQVPFPGPTLNYERAVMDQGFARVAGVDEAGRGPLAGPVVAGAVLLPPDFGSPHFQFLNDSKRLSANLRATLFDELQAGAEWGIGIVSARRIDKINIRQASWEAMKLAVADLKKRFAPVDFVLVDGLPCGKGPWPSQAIVRGDSKSLSIAAASVIAKVTRDRLMERLDAKYPIYNFAQHKGYPSREHRRALDEHGPCAIHRQTFAPVRNSAARFSPP